MDELIRIASPDIILSVPGSWPDAAALGASLAAEGEGAPARGRLRDAETGAEYRVEAHPPDADLARAFLAADPDGIEPVNIEAIAQCAVVVRVTAAGGSLAAAGGMLRMGARLLRAGGLGVRVETSGTAFSPADWLYLAGSGSASALYFAYVALVAHEGMFFSRGMHNAGRPDAMVGELDPNEAGALIEGFLRFVLERDPPLKEGHSYADSASGPVYRLSLQPCDLYAPVTLLHNPYGVWKLTPDRGGA